MLVVPVAEVRVKGPAMVAEPLMEALLALTMVKELGGVDWPILAMLMLPVPAVRVMG